MYRIKQDLKEYLNQDERINSAVKALGKWLKANAWESKLARKQIIKEYSMYDFVMSVLIKLCMIKPIPFVSFAQSIHLSDEMDLPSQIQTVMEMLIVIEPLDLFHMYIKNDRWYIESLLELPDDLMNRLIHLYYEPPKQTPTKPNTKTVLGGRINNHNKDSMKSLDVLYTLNNQAYCIDDWFMNNYQKQWHREQLSDDEYQDLELDEQLSYDADFNTWFNYQEQLNEIKQSLENKKFYFEYKYDKRGRVYTKGYHLNTQGTSFEKACINLKHKEIVTGEL